MVINKIFLIATIIAGSTAVVAAQSADSLISKKIPGKNIEK